jgi:hypothetical protein
VTAPSFGGALVADFWKRELPRLCRSDPAVWHAVVSLGSTNESHISGAHVKSSGNAFALEQFNVSIRKLMESHSHGNWWRALVISAIFTAICILQRKYEQARMHFISGYNLLRQYDNSDSPLQKSVASPSSAAPISIISVRSILTDFELRVNKLNSSKISELPSLLAQNSVIHRWKTYTAPRHPPPVGSLPATEDLTLAVQASESLFMALTFCSVLHAKKLKGLYTKERLNDLGGLGIDQTQHAACFREIGKALAFFEESTKLYMRSKGNTSRTKQLHKTLLLIRLMHTTTDVMFRRDPNDPKLTRHHSALAAKHTAINDLSEEIINLDKNFGCIRSGSDIPDLTVMNPLFIVAKTGYSDAVRLRAIELLRRPRLEGMWDSLQGAIFAETIMNREKAMSSEYFRRGVDDSIVINDFTSRGWEVELQNGSETHALARICNYNIIETDETQTKLGTRTWLEWLCGEPGHVTTVNW